ncbi:type 1 glutamine amidotransferase domain-containing protein [Sphingobacterium sp. ML3W]|uniref:type 1 glutamine amidotransferase domain-containing protein n=1 Tax=Sphingobacterium sp. ML3W TaxID=1538644 RepID=UPI00249BA657|nr:type 1 glutamine amidotransferase domain-containing protein [Sphingobacterium sp. ML3W]WFA82007.1 type 1 glutamine amidotransferase domain-containing protein [Sphingobacterium sp. ML3W]
MKKENLKVLVVLTSHDQLGDTGAKTGFWVEEFAAPYYVMADAGVAITIASPKGGQPPIDPKSALPDFQTAATKRFDADMELQNKLANSIVLAEVNEQDYDAIFYPGGHGPLWDLANDKTSIALIESFWKHNKPVAAVCHAPGVFRFVKNVDGSPLVQGKKVTGFSNSEEDAVQLTDVVPFLVEDELIKLGGHYSKGEDWGSHVVRDGKLITGQNPGSSEESAKELLALLEQ